MLFGQLRAGFDVSGKYKIAVEGESDTEDADSGIVIGYDAVMQDEGKLKLGVGGEFMIGRGIEDYAEGKASFHSVYGFGKYSLNEKAYGLARVGYNFHTGDDDYTDCSITSDCKITLEGGMMYAFGCGFSIAPKMALEGLFASHSGGVTLSANGEEVKGKITYTRISLGLIFIL